MPKTARRYLRPLLLLAAAGLLLGACASDSAERVRPLSQRGESAERQEAEREARRRQLPACRARPGMLTFNQDVEPGRMVTIAAVGDVLLHDSIQRLAASWDEGFYPLFAPVADLLQAADITFANLEGPAAASVLNTGRVTREPDRRYDGRVYTGYPMFNYHPSIARDLRRAGVDIVQTANNHALDRWAEGVDRTIRSLDAAGLAYTGTRPREAIASPWHAVTPVTRNGRTYNLAWLACTYATNDIPDREDQVLYCYEDEGEVLRQIRMLAARQDIDAVIVTPHWGAEYTHEPAARERALAQRMAEAGADAIIGTQPHVMQPVERIDTADGRQVPVAYSIGNFVSNQQGLPRRSSVILLLGFAPQPNGGLAAASMGWIPIRMHTAGGEAHAEAIDRAGRGAANRRHLLQHLPDGNLLPPTTEFWRGMACARPTEGS